MCLSVAAGKMVASEMTGLAWIVAPDHYGILKARP
jgi:hypothetical protein